LEASAIWLLCDYGEVLSTAQPHDDLQAMARVTGQELEDFISRYWIRRLDYDRGDLTPIEYWTTVVDAQPAPDQLSALMEIDSHSWTQPNLATLEAVKAAAESGVRLAILSNAPDPPARAIESMDWLSGFERIFFSCDLRRTKPDPEIFHIVVDELDAAPQDIVFVDDRIENVESARSEGLRALHFTGAAEWDVIRALSPAKG
jgi:putative hydrolase of the HAD superfamily